jgi:tetratricopeptide (TPR) repeat protein
MSITKKVLYPPDTIIQPSTLNKDFEFIMLWMLKNNDKCEWAHFLSDPVNISQATLSKYMRILLEKGLVEKVKKGVYKITSEGISRFSDLQSKEKLESELLYAPELITKKRNYEHTILWMLYNNSACKWSDFIEPPILINQSSLSKAINKLMDMSYIEKTDNREYVITASGESEYLKMLKEYDLDRQSLLNQESKRIEIITERTSQFFEIYRIEDNDIKYRFLTMALKLDYTKVEDISEEEDFDKILLFLSLNHPDEYPKYISPDKFAIDYDIDSITLKFFLRKIVDEKDIYPIKFFKLEADDEKVYYFQESEKIERVLLAIVEDHITKYEFLNKFHSKSLNEAEMLKIDKIINDILDEITSTIFDKRLEKALKKFLNDYIAHLAYKIETRKSLLNASERLESLIFPSFYNEYQPFIGPGGPFINGEAESYYNINDEIIESLEPFYLTKMNFFITPEIQNESISKENSDFFDKIKSLVYREKLGKLEEILSQNINNLNELEKLIINDIILTLSNKFEESIELISKLIENSPDSYFGYLFQSLNYFDLGNYEKALETVDRGLEISDNIFLNLQKAQILLRTSRCKAALELIDNILNSDSGNLFALRIKSLVYSMDLDCYKTGKNIDIIEEAIEKSQNDKELLIVKAMILCFNNKYKEVEEFITTKLGFDLFTKNSRVDTAALFMLIFSYTARGMITEALEMAYQLSIQFPDHPTSFIAKALALGYNLVYNFSEDDKNINKFHETIQNAISVENSNYRLARFYQLNALINYRLNERDNALKNVDKAITLDPTNYHIIFTKLALLRETEKELEALELIPNYIDKFPEQAIGLYILESFLLYSVGRKKETIENDREQAYECYQKGLDVVDIILSLDPNNDMALNNRVVYLAALNKQDEAIEAGENLITLRPEDGNNFDTFGEVLRQFGEYEEAIEMFKQAVKINPGGFYAHISYNRIAECYFELGDYENALEAAEKSKNVADKLLWDEYKYDYTADKLIKKIKDRLKNESTI